MQIHAETNSQRENQQGSAERRPGRRPGMLELKTKANRSRRTKDGDKNESLLRSDPRENRVSGGEKRSWTANLLTDENRNQDTGEG
jgi:hypothetical protein